MFLRNFFLFKSLFPANSVKSQLSLELIIWVEEAEEEKDEDCATDVYDSDSEEEKKRLVNGHGGVAL